MMKTETKGPLQIGGYILQLVPEGFLTRNELAAAVNRSYGTIIHWEQEGILKPTAYMQSGKTRMPLYTLQDAEDLKEFFRKMGART